MYVGDILGRRAIYSPDRLAIVDAGKNPHWKFTYKELNDRANRLANWLHSEVGVGKGDRVGIVAHSGVEFLDAFFACGKLGAILTCFNWRLHWRELLQIVETTTPRVMIFSEDFAAAVGQVVAEAQCITHLLHLEGQGISSGCTARPSSPPAGCPAYAGQH
jgi:fatty-acyl-CoA synthase